jgi:gliding motility-associated lipoprotein GldD
MKYINLLKGNCLFMVIAVMIGSCSDAYTPKPRGYFRIEFPEHKYKAFNENALFGFEIPTYSDIVPDSTKMAEPNWYDIVFKSMKGEIYLSYKPVKGDLSKYIEDSRTLVYKHTIKADDILEHPFLDNENKVFGVLYEIKGNAASPFQFFATDSLKHFLRGSLYFNVYPNKDSLAPVFDFIHEDIMHLIETIKWKQ